MATTVGTLNVKLTGDARGLLSAFTQVQSHLGRVQASIKGLAITAAAVSAPLIAVGTALMKSYGQFDRTLTRTNAIMGGTAANFERLKMSTLALSTTTEFTAGQMADAFETVALRGFDLNKSIAAMPSIAQLASAAQLDLAKSADILLGIMNSQRVGIGELPRVMDSLVAGANLSATSVEELGIGFRFIGATARQAGVALEESVATLAVLQEQGQAASGAGRGLRQLINSLSKATISGGATREAFRELGLEALFMGRETFPSLAEVSDTLGEAQRRLGNEIRFTSLLTTLFPANAATMAASLSGMGERVRGLTGQIEQMGGATKRVAEAQVKTFAGQTNLLKSAVEAAAFSMAQRMVPALTKVGDGLAGAIGWFEKLSDETKISIANFALMSTGVLTVLASVAAIGFVLQPVVRSLAAVMSILRLGFSAPVLAVAGAVISLLALSGALSNAYDVAIGQIKGYWADLKREIEDGFGFDPFQGMVDWATKAFDKIVELFAKTAREVRALGEDIGVFDRVTEKSESLDPETGQPTGQGTQWDSRPRKWDAPVDTDEAKKAMGAYAGVLWDGAKSVGKASWEFTSNLPILGGVSPGMLSVGADVASIGLTGSSASDVMEGKADLGLALKQNVETFLASLDQGMVLANERLLGPLIDKLKGAADAGLEKVGLDLPDFGALKAEILGLIDAIKNGKIAMNDADGLREVEAGSIRKTAMAMLPLAKEIDWLTRTTQQLNEQFGLAETKGFLPDPREMSRGFQIIAEKWMPKTTIDPQTGTESFEKGGLLEALGSFGDVVAGFMEAGSLVGGLASVLLQLVTGSEQFQQIVDVLGKIIGMIANTIGMVLKPLQPVVGAVALFVQNAIVPLGPLFEALGQSVESMAPMIKVLGELIGMIVETVLPPILVGFKAFGMILKVIGLALWVVLKAVGLVLINVLLGISWIWNGITGTLAWVLRKIDDVVSWLIGDVLDPFAAEVEKMTIDRNGLFEARNQLQEDISNVFDGEGDIFEGFNDDMRESQEAFDDLATTTERVNEALKNVPDGFKVALARFNAQDARETRLGSIGMSSTPITGITGGSGGLRARDPGPQVTGSFSVEVPHLAEGGIVRKPTLAVIGEAGPERVEPLGRDNDRSGITIGTVIVQTNDPDEFERKLMRRARAEGRTGSVFAPKNTNGGRRR